MVGIYDSDGNYDAKKLFVEREGINLEELGIYRNQDTSTLLSTYRKKYGEIKQPSHRTENRLERRTRKREGKYRRKMTEER